MKLITDNELKWSPVVANNRMNRQRGASGINSYEKEIGFTPEQFLLDCINKNGKVKWLDLCCGKGNALLQVAIVLSDHKIQDKASLIGIDLVDDYSEIPVAITCVQFKTGLVSDMIGNEKYDLITCIHGLHYIGDKLECISSVIGSLNKDGIFIGNIDPANIWIDGVAKTKAVGLFREKGIEYNGRKKLLKAQGNKKIKFDLIYLGADDTAGPNYTGQEAVHSHYTTQAH
jgi:hypothetical protein